MNILVIGRGGREHSIVMKLAESEKVTTIYAAPGNGGIQQQATCIAIDEMDMDGLVDFARKKAIDLTIVGPESPLNEGITDRFQEAGLAVFAPTSEAALLEGSKSFAKEFMKKHEIPTASYATFTNAEEAKQYIEEKGAPIVIKADGLAAGKGVIVAETKELALQAVDEMLVSKNFAEAGATIVIEEFLAGKEFSLMAFVHENNVYPMVTARDHKRAYDNDEGPNTGGMGAYAPVEDVTNEHLAFATEEILQKTADSLMKEGRPFTGILYAGLIMTADGPKVIEFNTRFGDPETQVVLPLLKNDLVQVLVDVMDGNNPELEWEDSSCTGVVVASDGYPGSYHKGILLPKMKAAGSSFTIHGGTKLEGDTLVSDGGRVLLVGAKDTTLEEATDNVYGALASAGDMDGFIYRRDIGKV
ncbi:phosphoribosylamine--glycine ligase [Virgibacillus natechei]|uniref:Phosphoribosylamine--glycine ligase n=1 Tax=Virgibacillus natechei TaxID=1216297 RepID=A0ABS4IHJ3_9BACI|nr:phosphoribosylamine--glycine ligase [Virgibacillus natechei]MBP1970423.1 phosphoribosylamine--glycine ligase [Virgibacillus natechei]UZD13923.1 phosphoribosylamine--glycine ligase [Virgibacillus natechei]